VISNHCATSAEKIIHPRTKSAKSSNMRLTYSDLNTENLRMVPALISMIVAFSRCAVSADLWCIQLSEIKQYTVELLRFQYVQFGYRPPFCIWPKADRFHVFRRLAVHRRAKFQYSREMDGWYVVSWHFTLYVLILHHCFNSGLSVFQRRIGWSIDCVIDYLLLMM